MDFQPSKAYWHAVGSIRSYCFGGIYKALCAQLDFCLHNSQQFEARFLSAYQSSQAVNPASLELRVKNHIDLYPTAKSYSIESYYVYTSLRL